MAVVFALCGTLVQGQESDLSQESLNQWLVDFRPRAAEAGVGEQALAALEGLGFLSSVVDLDRNQNEFSKTLWDYLDSAVSDGRIAGGERAIAAHGETLAQIEAEYGVDRYIVAAIWGLESAYGAVRGDTPTLAALATLAHEGRRGAFFEAQLIAALQILQAGDTTADQMRGSWAGAMGHTQFMPGNFDRLAVDYDGDGRRDIWGDDPTDALASTAVFLRDAGWTTGQPWGVEVTLPEGFDYDAARRTGTRVPSAWASVGVTAVRGEMPDDALGGASILLPAGHRGPALMIFGNFKVLERYNTADAYVIAVGHLADRLRGDGAFARAWPREDRALTLDERRELQQLLTDAGHSTLGVDGIVGPNTINAARRFQRANGLLPDGYISAGLLDSLRGE